MRQASFPNSHFLRFPDIVTYMNTTLTDVMPSATPSDADIEAWQALPRDEQVRRMRLSLSMPDCQTESTATMASIRAEAQARAAARRNG